MGWGLNLMCVPPIEYPTSFQHFYDSGKQAWTTGRAQLLLLQLTVTVGARQTVLLPAHIEAVCHDG